MQLNLFIGDVTLPGPLARRPSRHVIWQTVKHNEALVWLRATDGAGRTGRLGRLLQITTAYVFDEEFRLCQIVKMRIKTRFILDHKYNEAA